MSKTASLKGLNCPNCGGMIPIPEGFTIVRCPFCELRSFIRGERGLRRYQVPLSMDREGAEKGVRNFLSSHKAIDGKVPENASIIESFVAYLPFWVHWSKVLGWVFGEEKVRHGDDTRYEPREVKITQEMSWNKVACDVGEFGVTSLPLTTQKLEPFDPEELHAHGMVFEPVGSATEAQTSSALDFKNRVKQMADLDRVAQVYTRLTHSRLGLVYYPLWVLRYVYRGRAFQVAIDGFNGTVLYGKAPGSSFNRALVLVGGMAAGAFVAVDVAALAAYIGINLEGDGVLMFLGGALAAFVAGIGFMVSAYRRFRYGEIFEYRGHQDAKKRRTRKKVGEVYRAQEIIQ
jgi:hypothetical protein